jgi:hypothetical protein
MAVMEKHATNPHPHILLSSRDATDQSRRADFLLEMLDNVPKPRKDLRDEQWQRERWANILDTPTTGDELLRDRTCTLLTDLAPAGTAMVQLVRTEDDLEKVCRYMTKTWVQTQHQLASQARMAADDSYMDFKLLRDFHAPVDPARVARKHRLDRRSGAVLPSHGAASAWKALGRILSK